MTRRLTITLTDEQADILECCAFLDGRVGRQQSALWVRDVLNAHLAQRLATEPAVQMGVQARRTTREREQANVTPPSRLRIIQGGSA